MMERYICLAGNSWNGDELTPREETGIFVGDCWRRQDEGDRRTQRWRRDRVLVEYQVGNR